MEYFLLIPQFTFIFCIVSFLNIYICIYSQSTSHFSRRPFKSSTIVSQVGSDMMVFLNVASVFGISVYRLLILKRTPTCICTGRALNKKMTRISRVVRVVVVVKDEVRSQSIIKETKIMRKLFSFCLTDLNDHEIRRHMRLDAT